MFARAAAVALRRWDRIGNANPWRTSGGSLGASAVLRLAEREGSSAGAGQANTTRRARDDILHSSEIRSAFPSLPRRSLGIPWLSGRGSTDNNTHPCVWGMGALTLVCAPPCCASQKGGIRAPSRARTARVSSRPRTRALSSPPPYLDLRTMAHQLRRYASNSNLARISSASRPRSGLRAAVREAWCHAKRKRRDRPLSAFALPPPICS